MTALTAAGLTRRFGDLVAVDDLTFEVSPRQVVGFIGPNGSGKSTTIRLLLGLIRPTAGSGSVLGEPIESPERFAPRVGALIEAPAFVGTISGRDNLRSLAALRGIPARRIDEVLETVGLAGRDGDRADTYSLGMKQRLGIAAALLPDPELLVLDEPTNGLDPAGIVEIRQLLRRLAAEGRTVVVSSHLLSEIQAACDSMVIIRSGRLVYSGGLSELMALAGERVLAAPENEAQTGALATALERAGIPSDRDGDALAVEIDAESSADVDRVANAAGITLRMLAPERESLEDVFLRMTGSER